MNGRTTIKGALSLFGYRLIDILGTGDFGTCYEICRNEKVYVFKVFKPNDVKRRKSKLFLEGKLLKKISHQRIPHLVDTIDKDGVYGLVMEKMPGNTLEDFIALDYTFTKSEVLTIISQIIRIVEYLHDSGVYHRDVKTTNILWDLADASLIDFGSARRIPSQSLRFNQDFWGIGDVFMRLAVISQDIVLDPEDLSINALILSDDEKKVISRLLYIGEPYENIKDLSRDFQHYFCKQ